MTAVASPIDMPIIRPDLPSSRAVAWRQELADLCAEGCDQEALEGFVLGLMEEALGRSQPHRQFIRGEVGTAMWGYGVGFNRTLTEVRKMSMEVLREYRAGK